MPLSPGQRCFQLFFEEIKYLEKDTFLRKDIKCQKKYKNDSLANLIFQAKHKPYSIINCINQTLAAITMIQSLGITHYDLHADNVMITNTEYDVNVYKLRNNVVQGKGPKQISIQTYGISPVIIDFGMAYVPNNKYNTTCKFSSSGFTTFMPDDLVDARLLLLTSIEDLGYTVNFLKKNIFFPSSNLPRHLQQRSTTKTTNTNTNTKIIIDNEIHTNKTKSSDVVNLVERYVKKVKLMFAPLKLQQNGWLYENCFNDIIDDIVNNAPKILLKRKNGIFKKKDNFQWILELMQHEITLPLTTNNEKELISFNEAILAFASEWIFVEQIIRNTKEEQLFLKELVSMNEDIKDFIKMKHRYPKIQNLKRLKQTIKTASMSFKKILINEQKKIEKKKKLMYSKLPYQTVEDILNALPKPPITYKKDMKVHFVDINSKCSFNIVLDEVMAKKLNDNEQDELSKYFDQN
jgi:hypothetical protein